MPKPHQILSLDLATSAGWCYIEGTEYLYSGVLSLKDQGGHGGLRFLKFQNWLHDYRGVNEIFYEKIDRFESGDAAKVYCGLRAILLLFSLQHGIQVHGLTPKTIKKHFTGNGNASKELVCKVAHQLGWKHGELDTDIDHDEADAIALAYAILERREQELVFNPQ